MPIATITSVNLPTHQYPHVEVNINDNTLRRYTTIADEYGKTLCVFRSPKGPDGIKKITGLDQFVDTYGRGSVDQYGQPLLNAYTLASTNAITQYCLRVTANDAKVANLHIYARYRVKEVDKLAPNADDTSAQDTTVQEIVCGNVTKTLDTTAAGYKGITIYSHSGDDGSYDYIKMSDAGFTSSDNFYTAYRKIGEAQDVERQVEDPEDPEQTITITVKVRTLVTPTEGTDTGIVNYDAHTHSSNMQVYFVAKSSADVTDVQKISEAAEYYDDIRAVRDGAIVEYDTTVDDVPIAPTGADPDPDAYYDTNWKEVRLMSITALGKGIYGNTISFAFMSDPNRDKSNDYKNYWIQIYEGSTLIEKFAITLTSNGQVRGESKYISNVVNDDDNTGEASSVIRVDFNEAGLLALYNVYNTRVSPATISYDIFDVLFGKDKRRVSNRAIPDNMSGMTGYEIVEAPTGALYDNDAEFIPYTLGGTALANGNDGNFALESDGGTAEDAEDVIANVNTAYREIFGGKSEVKKATYKTIDTVVIQTAVTNGKGEITKIVNSATKTLPKGGLELFFDEKNNYLVHLVDTNASTGTDEVILKDIKGNPVIDLEPDQMKHNHYVRISKISNVVYIPPIETWVPDIDPAIAALDYPYPDILTKNKTEIDFFLDANYDFETKIAICNWVNKYRHEDFVVYLDAGTSETLVSKVDGYTWVQSFDEATNGDEYEKYWYFSIDAYYGRIKDPYNFKIVEVTSTYNLARHLVPHWAANGGKHIPYAGSLYAVIDSYLPRSVFPLMDEGLDSEHMDRFIEEHVNYAQVNSRGDVIRATQSTRYPVLGDAFTLSNLTELNNVHIVLDIKKDVEHVLELFTYQFNEQSDLKRFNTIVSSSILPKYSAAQVKSISATFNRTSEEAEYGILHLYIEVVHKNLVKIIMVDIDVNRNID
jgi:hypothetical protein